jgi:flagellar biosynthesis protein FlhA
MSDTTADEGVPVAAPPQGGEAPDQGGPAAPGFFSPGEIWLTLKRGDVGLGIGILVILTLLILPIPPMVLDMFLAVSIIFSVLVLMTACSSTSRWSFHPSRRFC